MQDDVLDKIFNDFPIYVFLMDILFSFNLAYYFKGDYI